MFFAIPGSVKVDRFDNLGRVGGTYGDPSNDELFYDFEVVRDKWATQYVGDYNSK